MCLPITFWRTERRTVVIPMMSQFGCLELLITETFLSGPVKFEITRVDCILKILPSKIENFQIKNSNNFHISAQSIDCGDSLELPRCGGSNKYLQFMF